MARMYQRYRKRTRTNDIVKSEKWVECRRVQLDQDYTDSCCWEHFQSVAIKVVTFSVSYLWQHCQWTLQPPGTISSSGSSGGGWQLKGSSGRCRNFLSSRLINNWEPSLTTQEHLPSLILPCHFHTFSFIMCCYCTTPVLLKVFVVKKERRLFPPNIVGQSFCKMQ